MSSMLTSAVLRTPVPVRERSKDHVVHDHPEHAAAFAKTYPREHAVPGEPLH